MGTVWLTDLIGVYRPSTARRAFLVLYGCLELATADELIKRNPGQSKIVKKPGRRFSQVIGSATGLRQGELFALSLVDFDFEGQVIRVRRQVKRLRNKFVFAMPKTDEERIVPVSPSLAKEHIEQFGRTAISLPWEQIDGDLQEHDLLFAWSDGKVIRARNYKRGRWGLQDRLHEGMHALRHYFASIALADGVNIKELSEYLGPYDPGFTLQMYPHMLPSSYDRARQAVDRRLERLASRLTEQGRFCRGLGPGIEVSIHRVSTDQ